MKYILILLLIPLTALGGTNGLDRLVHGGGSLDVCIDQILDKEHVFKAILVSAGVSSTDENQMLYTFELTEVIKGNPRKFKYLYSIIEGTSYDMTWYVSHEYLFYLDSDYINISNTLPQDYLKSLGYEDLSIKISEIYNNRLASDAEYGQNN